MWVSAKTVCAEGKSLAESLYIQSLSVNPCEISHLLGSASQGPRRP